MESMKVEEMRSGKTPSFLDNLITSYIYATKNINQKGTLSFPLMRHEKEENSNRRGRRLRGGAPLGRRDYSP
jgi:hypothetical protein